MLKTITDINETEIPAEGLNCSVMGFFFYCIADSQECERFPSCFLSVTDKAEGSNYITLPVDVGESVISEDETFGMLVGGHYAYYGLAAIVTGILSRDAKKLIFKKVEKLYLEKDGVSQEFQISK